MKEEIKNNFSKIEKITLSIYIGYVLIAKLIFDKLLVSMIALIVIIILITKKKSKNEGTNYLINEKMKLIIRHFFLLSILWNIIFGIAIGELLYEDSIINILLDTIILGIFLLPFAGILKAISKIKKISTYTNIELYRELPQNIEPAIVAYLMQDKLVDKSEISATLLDLVRRKYLIMKDDISDGFDNVLNGILNKKLIINKNLNELKEYERFLVEWFSATSDNHQEIDMSKLKEMLKESKMQKSNYYKWESLVEKEANRLNFFDDTSKLSKISKFSEKWSKKFFMISIGILILATIGLLFGNTVQLPNIFYIVTAILFIAHMGLSTISIIIYNLRLPKEYLNPLGQENIKKWNGFIKFLKEYTLINERKTEEVHIWEEYLVYGVAFGVAKETINSMNQAYGIEADFK